MRKGSPMPIYLVDVAMRNMGRDYAALWSALREANAQDVTDTTWLVDVSQAVDVVTNALLSHLAKGDRLFVIEIRSETVWTATGLDQPAKEWLQSRISNITGGTATVAQAAA